jgi:hypothetical protein
MPCLLEFCRKATCYVTCEISWSKVTEHHSEFTALHLVLMSWSLYHSSLQNTTWIQLYSIFLHLYTVAWDSVVSIVTYHRLHGPGIKSRWGRIFCTHPDWPWIPPSLLYNGYWVFLGGKAAKVWHWPPTPSSAEVKERVELYLYSLFGPSLPLLQWKIFGQRGASFATLVMIRDLARA